MGKIYKLSDLRQRSVSYEEDAVYISEHAFKRIKERVGWNRKSALRMVDKIYESGSRAKDLKGYISLWINQKLKSKGFDEIILFGNHVFLFRNRVLITVYNVPSKGTCLREVA